MPAHDGAAEGAGRSETCGASASPAAFLRTGVSRCDGAGVGAMAGAGGTGARRSERCLDGGRRRGRRGLPHAYTQWASWISRGYLRRSLVYPPMPRRVSAVSALPGVRLRRVCVRTLTGGSAQVGGGLDAIEPPPPSGRGGDRVDTCGGRWYTPRCPGASRRGLHGQEFECGAHVRGR